MNIGSWKEPECIGDTANYPLLSYAIKMGVKIFFVRAVLHEERVIAVFCVYDKKLR
jgi:hypothetical protein